MTSDEAAEAMGCVYRMRAEYERVCAELAAEREARQKAEALNREFAALVDDGDGAVEKWLTDAEFRRDLIRDMLHAYKSIDAVNERAEKAEAELALKRGRLEHPMLQIQHTLEQWWNEDPEMRYVEILCGENLRVCVRLFQISTEIGTDPIKVAEAEAGTLREAVCAAIDAAMEGRNR